MGRDSTHKLFTRDEYFQYYPRPSITVSSPQSGPSGSQVTKPDAATDQINFPTLSWHPPPTTASRPVREYLLIVEDLDAGFAGPETIGIFYKIPATITSISAKDLAKASKESRTSNRDLVGGFKYAPIGRRLKVWSETSSILSRGTHRYYFQVVALSGTVEKGDIGEFPIKRSFLGMMEGRIMGWGEWMGLYGK